MATVTGNGTTFALSVGTVARVISINGFSETLDSIDNNALDTDGHDQYVAGDTTHHGEITMDVVFDPAALTTFAGATVTGTLTFSDTSTLSGTGFITERSFGTVANNERIEGTITWRFDGETGPAWA